MSNAESGFFRPVPLPDGNLVVFHYTGKGFVPAVIEPRPLENVSAIRFLGAELVAKHPVVTTWQANTEYGGARGHRGDRTGTLPATAQSGTARRLSRRAGLQGLR
ncbi:MAG TPA: hypothetical protein VN874_03695, partial [Myxococcales bacterium]|nr:hypothetical protein [Myxococcales bacterium]